MHPTTLLSLALALAASQPKTPPKDADQPSLLGEWSVETRVRGGMVNFLAKPLVLDFTADGKVIFREYGKEIGTSKFTADSSKTPAELNWTLADGELPRPGIYRIEKDTLTFCVDHAGTRPTKFESPDGSQVGLWTLKRVKKKE